MEVRISDLLKDEKEALDLIEERIRSRLAAEAPLLTDISTYLLALGGKRIRPLVTVLANKLFVNSRTTEELIDVAAGIELIHMATLLHDDIIDESPIRRHKVSAYVRFGLAPSLLAGDFLLVRAFGLCAHLDAAIVDATERACVELTEGEILEGQLTSSSPRSLDSYIDVVGKKTASLFALAGEVGARLANVSARNVQKMRTYGYWAGVAFQMIDDILDVVSTEDLLGKPSGTDLRQKTPSLVNILWLESGDRRALDFFTKETITAGDSAEAMNYLRNTAVIEQCREVAKKYASLAKSAVNDISDGGLNLFTKEKLLGLIDYTLNRCL
ncbi:MAG: polyprenyl synthetase family protein [Deltaproteobacteria bacterium]|nr:polyprenyl synthetase family protein [Deltaproteobacteria bacterium]